jgi:ribosomal protein S18 acetylase RimI-like enzyme
MIEQFYIRSATNGDLKAVQTLLREAWHAAYDRIHGAEEVAAITADWHSLSNLSASLKRPWSEFLLADTGEELAGMAYAAQSSEDFAVLHQLYVEPAKTSQGIGAALLSEIFEAFPEAKAFRLEVNAQNPGAMRFYERHGFREISRVENCGKEGSGMPAVVMERRA